MGDKQVNIVCTDGVQARDHACKRTSAALCSRHPSTDKTQKAQALRHPFQDVHLDQLEDLKYRCHHIQTTVVHKAVLGDTVVLISDTKLSCPSTVSPPLDRHPCIGLGGMDLGASSQVASPTPDAPAASLLDFPDALLSVILVRLPLTALFAASSTCSRLYDLSLPLYGGNLQRLQEQAAAAKEASGATSNRAACRSADGTRSAAVPPDKSVRATRAGLQQQRAACAQYLKLACTHCGTIPKGHKTKEHPVNDKFRLCRQCAKLEDYKMITLDNAMATYGLLKTDLRRLPQFRETKKVPGKGASSRWKTYTWYCLQDVEVRAEELFGEGFRDRADLLAHED